MAERLLVRFSGGSQDSLEWLVVSERQQLPQTGALADLVEVAQGKEIILLLPAPAVLLLEIELPLKRNAQIKKALPFAVEDLLADDVDSYHLVWLPQSQNKLPVAAVAHEKIAACLAQFRQAGLELEAIYPESLCLPHHPEGVSVLIDHDQAIFRSGLWSGGGVDISFLGQLLELSNDDGSNRKMLHVWGGPIADDVASECVLETFSTPLQLFAEGYEAGAPFNLLSGPYAPIRDTGGWRPWLPVWVVLMVAMVIQYGGLLKQNWQLQTSLADLETQTLALFKQSFPDVKRVVNVRAQADQQLAELRKTVTPGGSGFMSMLHQSGKVLKENPDLRLRKLNFLNGSLQMQLMVADIGQLEGFKRPLESKYQVKVQSADNVANRVEVLLEIRQK